MLNMVKEMILALLEYCTTGTLGKILQVGILGTLWFFIGSIVKTLQSDLANRAVAYLAA